MTDHPAAEALRKWIGVRTLDDTWPLEAMEILLNHGPALLAALEDQERIKLVIYAGEMTIGQWREMIDEPDDDAMPELLRLAPVASVDGAGTRWIELSLDDNADDWSEDKWTKGQRVRIVRCT